MVGRNGALGVLIGAAVGTLFLVPTQGSAQDSLSVSCVRVTYSSRLEDLTRCAELGYADAQVSLGVMHERGDGLPWDIVAAIHWYRLAADQGHDVAQLHLGFLHANGTGVAEDRAEAGRWYRLAAEQGNAAAELYLGQMYYSGDGVLEDYAEAVRWFRLAAEQRSALAQSHLGFMYTVGDGVPKDLVYAYMWLDLSAVHGNGRARSGQEVIMEQMTREQIVEAQRLSREWIETHPQGGGN